MPSTLNQTCLRLWIAKYICYPQLRMLPSKLSFWKTWTKVIYSNQNHPTHSRSSSLRKRMAIYDRSRTTVVSTCSPFEILPRYRSYENWWTDLQGCTVADRHSSRSWISAGDTITYAFAMVISGKPRSKQIEVHSNPWSCFLALRMHRPPSSWWWISSFAS